MNDKIEIRTGFVVVLREGRALPLLGADGKPVQFAIGAELNRVEASMRDPGRLKDVTRLRC